jgi:hypothetical protein
VTLCQESIEDAASRGIQFIDLWNAFNSMGQTEMVRQNYVAVIQISFLRQVFWSNDSGKRAEIACKQGQKCRWICIAAA